MKELICCCRSYELKNVNERNQFKDEYFFMKSTDPLILHIGQLGNEREYSINNFPLIRYERTPVNAVEEEKSYINSMIDFLQNNSEVRIWYDSSHERPVCEFYYICSLLQNCPGKFYVFRHEFDDLVNTGFFDSSSQKDYVDRHTSFLSREEIIYYAKRWEQLVVENTYNRKRLSNGEIVGEYPDIRDGLTTLQRQTLFVIRYLCLSGECLTEELTKSSCTIVGEILGKFCKTCDEKVYDTVVKMVQPFRNNNPLIIGVGDFGAENKSAEGYEYTSCKLSSYGEMMFEGIKQNGVDFILSKGLYGHTEPVVLPAKFPHLLCNGNYEIPGHNYEKVLRAIEVYKENPEISIEQLASIIGKPVFPDGKILLDEDFLEYYKTGKMDMHYKTNDSSDIKVFHAQNRVLVDGEQKIVNLKEMISAYVEHRKSVEERIIHYEQSVELRVVMHRYTTILEQTAEEICKDKTIPAKEAERTFEFLTSFPKKEVQPYFFQEWVYRLMRQTTIPFFPSVVGLPNPISDEIERKARKVFYEILGNRKIEFMKAVNDYRRSHK